MNRQEHNEEVELREFLNNGRRVSSGGESSQQLTVANLIVNRANLWSSTCYETYVRNAVMEHYNATVHYIHTNPHYLHLREVIVSIRYWLLFWVVSALYIQSLVTGKIAQLVVTYGAGIEYEKLCLDEEGAMCDCYVTEYDGMTNKKLIVDCEQVENQPIKPTPIDFRILMITLPILFVTVVAFLACFASTKLKAINVLGWAYFGELLLIALLLTEATLRYDVHELGGKLLAYVDAILATYCVLMWLFIRKLHQKLSLIDLLLGKGEEWLLQNRVAYAQYLQCY